MKHFGSQHKTSILQHLQGLAFPVAVVGKANCGNSLVEIYKIRMNDFGTLVFNGLTSTIVCSITRQFYVPKIIVSSVKIFSELRFLCKLDHSKGTVRCLACMDHEKIDFDLIEMLIEWILNGNHKVGYIYTVSIHIP